jgi:hypothetical protein
MLILWIFLLLLIFVVYTLNYFDGSFFVGMPCGIIIAIVTSCDTLKRTVITRITGLFSAVVAQVIFEILGTPYSILMYIFRNDSAIKEIQHLTINETIGYGWGRFLFWGGVLIAFVISVLSIFIFHKVQRRSA